MPPPIARDTSERHVPSRGHCYLYVFPCAWEDHCKLGFSRDPLSRMQALHRRWFEFFDIDHGLLVETETVQLEFKDEMSQAVVKPIGAEGYDYTYVIMPMRI